MNSSNIIDVLFMGSGIYLIYTAIMAKKNGEIAANVMLGKNMDEKKIKDKVGFIDYMYKRILLAGILVVIAGLMNYVNDIFFFSKPVTAVASGLIIVAIVLYFVASKKGQKQYLILQESLKENEKKRTAD